MTKQSSRNLSKKKVLLCCIACMSVCREPGIVGENIHGAYKNSLSEVVFTSGVPTTPEWDFLASSN